MAAGASSFLPPFAESRPPMGQPINVGPFSALDTIPDATMSAVPGVGDDPSMVPSMSRPVAHQQITVPKTVTLVPAGDNFEPRDCFTYHAPLFMRNLHAEKQVALNSMIHQGLSIYALNTMLRTAYGRRVYGSKRTAAEVLREWGFAGFQMADEEELKNSNAFVGMSVLIDGPVDTANIWLAEDGHVSCGDEAFLLLVRRRFEADLELKDVMPAMSSASSSSVSASMRAARHAAFYADTAAAAQFGYDIEIPVVERFDDNKNDLPPPFYWRVEPVACHRRCRPQKERYNNLTGDDPDALFAGAAIHVGTIEWCDLPPGVSPDDSEARAEQFRLQAQDVLHSAALGAELRRSLLTMPTCTLHTLAEAQM